MNGPIRNDSFSSGFQVMMAPPPHRIDDEAAHHNIVLVRVRVRVRVPYACHHANGTCGYEYRYEYGGELLCPPRRGGTNMGKLWTNMGKGSATISPIQYSYEYPSPPLLILEYP